MAATKRYYRDQTAYNRAFQKAMAKAMPGYNLCESDWLDASMEFRRTEPEEAAARLAERRQSQIFVASRVPAKVWRDEFTGEATTGTGGGLPEAVLVTIRAAFDNGCTHGTVIHWEYYGLDKRDHYPLLVCWEALR